MFNNEQKKVLKDSLEYRYGKNIITIRENSHCTLPNIKEALEVAKVENNIILQIEDIIRQID